MNIEEMVTGSVKAAMKDSGAGSRDLWQVPIDSIETIPGFNVRIENSDYAAHIETLADSIIANGFYPDKPLTGYVAKVDGKNVIYITDGHSRLRAAKLAVTKGAEIATLPVVIRPQGTSAEDLVVGLVTSNNGRPLQPLEIAEVCKRLVGYGKTPAEIARRLSLSANYVGKLLTLIAAPKDIRKLVEAGKVSATLAMDTLAKKPEKATAILKAAVEKAKTKGKGKATRSNVGAKPVRLDGELIAVGIAQEDSCVISIRVSNELAAELSVGMTGKLVMKAASDDEL